MTKDKGINLEVLENHIIYIFPLLFKSLYEYVHYNAIKSVSQEQNVIYIHCPHL